MKWREWLRQHDKFLTTLYYLFFMFKKILIVLIGLVVVFALVFALNIESNTSSLIIYFNGAVINEKFNDAFILPKDVIEESITTFGKDYYLTYPKSEVSSLIGKDIEVMYDEGKELKGKLIDVKNGKFYILSNDKTFVVKPEAFSVDGVFYSDRQGYPTIHSQGQTLISYAVPSLKWKGQLVLTIKDKKADVSIGALIKNLDEEKAYNSTNAKLISGDVNFYRNHNVFMVYPTYSKSLNDEGNIEVSQKEGFLEYSLSNIFIPPKGVVFKELGSFTTSFSKFNRLNTYFSSKFDARNPELLFSFKAEENIPSGVVKVYDKKGEFLGLDHVDEIPKGENVTVSIGENRFVRIMSKEIMYDDRDIFYERKMRWQIKNFGERNEVVELIVHMPYNNWTIISSKGNYEVLDKDKIKFFVSVNPGGEVNLSMKIKVKKFRRFEQ